MGEALQYGTDGGDLWGLVMDERQLEVLRPHMPQHGQQRAHIRRRLRLEHSLPDDLVAVHSHQPQRYAAPSPSVQHELESH